MPRPAKLALVLLLAASALAGVTPEKPPVPAVLAAEEAEVKKLTEAAAKAVETKDDELRIACLGEMESLRHESFEPVIRAGAKAKDPRVVAVALRAAAAHEMKEFEKDVRRLLRTKKKDDAALPGVLRGAVIDYLGRLGFTGEETIVLEDCLKPMFADERRMKATWSQDLARACIDYLGRSKHKPAVPQLVEMVRLPQPVDVHDGKNPPASYWEARVKLWQASEGWVRWALKEITGLEYRSAGEWEAWLKQNRKDFK